MMNILFIDDERALLNSFKAQFRSEYNVNIASSIDEALEIIEKSDIHVVLCDYMLKEKDGIQFFANLKNTHPNISRVLITGGDAAKVALDAINLGNIYRFVEKPWNDYELKIVLKQAYEHNRLIEANKALIERLMSNERLIELLSDLKK